MDNKLKELYEKYKTPENCKFLCVPKVNSELWHVLSKEAKNKDLGLQEGAGRTYQQRSSGKRATFLGYRGRGGRFQDRCQVPGSSFTESRTKISKGQSIGKVCPLPLMQAGSLMNNLHKWREITSDPWILETVSGYHLEFESLRYQSKLPNLPTFSTKETELIEAEINKLISKGAISEVYPCHDEFMSNLFLVPKKTGDFSPVINLKPLN